MSATSIVLANKTTGQIPTGKLIISDSGLAREFASGDNVEQVIGVIYPLINNSGRAFGGLPSDGPPFYADDAYLYNTDLTYQVDSNGNLVINTNFDGIGVSPEANPTVYSKIITNGYAAVDVTASSVPSRWILMGGNSDYNYYLIR